jgi:hypothetical protein
VNARQRRRRRRAFGCKPPFKCFWCHEVLEAWDGACACPPHDHLTARPRKMTRDLTVKEWVREYVRRGLAPPELTFVAKAEAEWKVDGSTIRYISTSPEPSDEALGAE